MLTYYNIHLLKNKFRSVLIYYFAYGSNMFICRLKGRIPSAQVVGKLSIQNFDLRWHKVSNNDGSGKCNIFRTDKRVNEVWGVLYTMNRNELHLLDRAEGCGNGYRRIEICGKYKHTSIEAFTYSATKIDYELLPFYWYKMYVLKGAQEHDLPESYLSKISLVSSVKDPDRNRAKRHLKVLFS